MLVACESSGAVRRAFRARGHNAWSCDIKQAEDDSHFHIRTDVVGLLEHRIHPDACESAYDDDRPLAWDLLIAFPPCTDLAVSGARWFPAKVADGRQGRALGFVRMLMGADVPRIAIENPVSIISSAIRRPDQTIQPWQFGHGEVKRTCLWLKNLPLLVPTNIVEGREARVWKMGPSPTRAADRARTFDGIAAAMAAQWGGCDDARR